MADANYYIDLILRARDETAAAFASATANQTAFNRIQEDTARKNAELEKSFDRINERLDVQISNLRQAGDEYNRQGERIRGFSTEALAAEVKLERAARAHAQAQADASKSDAERAIAARNLASAQSAYVKVLKDSDHVEEAYSDSSARRRAKKIADMQAEGVAAERLARIHEQAAKKEAQAEQEATRQRIATRRLLQQFDDEAERIRVQREREQERARQKRIADDKREGQEHARVVQQMERDRVAAYSRMQQAARKLADEKITPQDFDRFRRELVEARKDMTDLGVSGRRAGMDMRRALDEAGASASNLRREQLRQIQLEQQQIEITRNREKAQRDLTNQTKVYAREVDNLARLRRQEQEAKAHGADAAGLLEMNREIEISKQRLRELAVEIKAVSQERIVVGVDADTGEAITTLLDFEAVKKVVGRDIHLNVDVDTGAAIAKLVALEMTAKKGLRGSDADVSWWRQFTESIQQSSNQVATFDNFIRGLVSLGIGVFLNQIIVLAGAAAGALTALAGSAIYAGGALGGALVSGLAQALPVLGLVAVAVQRISDVWKAAQQQQLLQQQQFAKHGKLAKQSADATDAIANAEDSLAAAQKRVKDAQQGVFDARQKAIRQLQDLILQERQAELAAKGAALSQEEAQEALRRAVSSGDTGAVARARLTLEESKLNARQTDVQQRRVRQDLASRRNADRGPIEGSPEVTQAKDQLDAAKQAAEQAERSMEKARRTANNTGADALAAAGKLDFMLSQMSDSERKLYEQFTKFIDAVRIQGGKMVEPIIQSVTHLMSRVNGLLNNPGLIQAARKLSGQIGDQMTRAFNHFTSPKFIKFWKDMMGEAGKNLRPLTTLIIRVGDAFANIAKAASPALRTLLKYFADLATKFAEWTGSKKGQKAMTEFFGEGVKQFKGWMRLLGALGSLLMAVINPKVGGGAKTGLNLLNDMTGAINKLDRAARSKEGRQFLQTFFERSRQALKELKPVIIAVAEQFARLFTPEGIKNVRSAAKLVSETLVPAFGDFMHLMGLLMRVVGVFLEIPLVGQLARIGIAGAATATIMGKLFTIFTPFTSFLKLLPTGLARMAGNLTTAGARLIAFGARLQIVSALGGPFGRTMSLMGRAAGAVGSSFLRMGTLLSTASKVVRIAVSTMFGPWGIVAAAVIAGLVALQLKFNIFGKAFDFLKKIVKGAVDWIKDFLGIRSPAKVFIDIAQAIVDGILWPLRKLGSLLKGAFEKGWDAIKSGVRAAARWINEHHPLLIAIRWVRDHIGELPGLFKDIWDRVVRGAGRILDFFKSLPGKLWNFAKEAAGKVTDAFKDVGEAIITRILRGFKNIGGFAKDIVNAFIDLLNTAIPNKIPVPGAPDIPLPDNPIPHLATGGYIGGRYSEGDRYTVKVAGEEVVLNPLQQAMIGTGKIFSVLRSTGAQFLRPGGAYATGGGPASMIGGVSVNVAVNQQYDRAVAEFRSFMTSMITNARRYNKVVEDDFRDLRDSVTDSVRRMRNNVSDQLDRLERVGKRHFDNLGDGASKTMHNLATSVYSGFRYIANATNTALKGFDADPVRFSIEAPPAERRATGGVIGQLGERGGDAIPILVGRGEAVLNWAHQKFIEPALHAMYGFGLGDLFKRVGGYHAGGPNQLGAPAFAKGGFTGPFGSGAAFKAISSFAKRKFGLTMTAGRTNHSMNTSSGNVSDHYYGLAGDFSNGVLTPQEDAFSGFIKSRIPQTIKQLIWRNKDQMTGWPIGGHLNHVHWALPRSLAFDAVRMARILSRASRNLSVSDLLAGVTGGTAQVEHIDGPKGKGKGFLLPILRRAMRKVTNAANAFLDKRFLESGSALGAPIDYSEHGKGALSRGQAESVIRNALRMLLIKEQVGKWVPMLLRQSYRESTWNPNAINNWDSNAAAGHPSKGFLQTIDSTFQRYKLPGHNNIYNALDNTLAAIRYMVARYGGGNPNKAVNTMWARGGGGYARGGFVGGRPFGPIMRAATGIFRTPGRVSGIRRSGDYQAPDILPIDVEGTFSEFALAVNAIKRAASGAIKKAKTLRQRAELVANNLTDITKENGLLAQMLAAIDLHAKNLSTKLRERVNKLKGGFVGRGISPEKEADIAIGHMRTILREQQAALKKINNAYDKAGTELRRVNRRIDVLDDIKKPTEAQKKELAALREQGQNILSGRRALRNQALELRNSIQDGLESLQQAQIERFQSNTDKMLADIKANVPGERGGQGGGEGRFGNLNLAQIEREQRTAQAWGRGVDTQRLEQARIDILKDQAKVLEDRMKLASRRGWTEQAQQLADQLADLQTTIQEATAAQIQANIDAINNAATRKLAAADRTSGYADLLDRIGGSGLGGVIQNTLASLGAQNPNVFTGNAGQMRQQALEQQYAALADQRRALQNVLNNTPGLGVDKIDELTAQLADLDKTIAENIVSQEELKTQIRQTAIDAITSRQQFQGGVYGALAGLSQAVAGNTGIPDPDRQDALLKQQRDTITTALSGLEDKLFEVFGIDARGATGNSLVDILKTVNFDQIEAGLTPAAQQQFEGLINQIIQLGTDLEGNTSALEQLNGNLQPQGFTSTAWSWFRNAVFTGMGDVLPQYTIPSFDTGGPVVRTGLAKLHAGEYVVNPAVKGSHAPTQEGDINIEINEAGGVPDPSYLAKRIAFERRAGRGSR